jgi:D-hexose-6-phosphate mutarotase
VAATGGWKQGVRNGLEVVELETPASTCTIALHGAQVLGFAPRGERDGLWISDKADFGGRQGAARRDPDLLPLVRPPRG